MLSVYRVIFIEFFNVAVDRLKLTSYHFIEFNEYEKCDRILLYTYYKIYTYKIAIRDNSN